MIRVKPEQTDNKGTEMEYNFTIPYYEAFTLSGKEEDAEAFVAEQVEIFTEHLSTFAHNLILMHDSHPILRQERTSNQKLGLILVNGWEEHTKGRYVKTKWLKEAQNGPNWYRTETLESAYNIAVEEIRTGTV